MELTVSVNMDGDTLCTDRTAGEVRDELAMIFHKMSVSITDRGEMQGSVLDTNGNTVAAWWMQEEVKEEECPFDCDYCHS